MTIQFYKGVDPDNLPFGKVVKQVALSDLRDVLIRVRNNWAKERRLSANATDLDRAIAAIQFDFVRLLLTDILDAFDFPQGDRARVLGPDLRDRSIAEVVRLDPNIPADLRDTLEGAIAAARSIFGGEEDPEDEPEGVQTAPGVALGDCTPTIQAAGPEPAFPEPPDALSFREGDGSMEYYNADGELVEVIYRLSFRRSDDPYYPAPEGAVFFTFSPARKIRIYLDANGSPVGDVRSTRAVWSGDPDDE